MKIYRPRNSRPPSAPWPPPCAPGLPVPAARTPDEAVSGAGWGGAAGARPETAETETRPDTDAAPTPRKFRDAESDTWEGVEGRVRPPAPEPPTAPWAREPGKGVGAGASAAAGAKQGLPGPAGGPETGVRERSGLGTRTLGSERGKSWGPGLLGPRRRWGLGAWHWGGWVGSPLIDFCLRLSPRAEERIAPHPSTGSQPP